MLPEYAAFVQAALRLARQFDIRPDAAQFLDHDKPVLTVPLPAAVIPPAEADGPQPASGKAVSPVTKDILAILSESKKPLTRMMILMAMDERKMDWAAKSVDQHLAALVADGTLAENGPGVKPRGFYIPAAE